MIIDFHTHIFPDALAPKAIASLQATAGFPVVFDGTAKGLLDLMKQDGIDKAIVLNTVTNVKQAEKVNAFALATMESHKELIPFCSLHPLCENPKSILKSLKDSGIKGVKIHPDYVGTELDDASMKPLLSAVTELGMPAVIHAGYDPVSPGKIHASPDAILKVINEFTGIRLVAAHLGGMTLWDEVAEKLCGKEVYFDTAFCCARTGITAEQGKRIFANHPHEKILFGSDAPWAKPSEVLGFVSELGLSDESLELVLHKNAEKLLKI